MFILEKSSSVARQSLLAGLAATALAAPALAENMSPNSVTTLGQPIALEFSNIADLTHTLSESTPYYHIDGVSFPFQLEPLTRLEEVGVYTTTWTMYDHHGTNINSPNHFIAGGAAADELDVRTFFAPLAIINIADRAEGDPDTALTVGDILTWEAEHGRLPAGSAVFQRADWDRFAGDLEQHLNRDADGVRRNPGFSAEAARFLVEERDIVGIGTETVAVSWGPDREFQAHQIVLGAGLWALENLTGLASVPESGATLIIGPPKVEDASGGMTRVLAVW
ncbi:MAG: cyclase family protein [Pseudomonadota bacterium]